MAEAKKIEVCQHCSGLDIAELKKKEKVNVGCIGKCSRKFPEFERLREIVLDCGLTEDL